MKTKSIRTIKILTIIILIGTFYSQLNFTVEKHESNTSQTSILDNFENNILDKSKAIAKDSTSLKNNEVALTGSESNQTTTNVNTIEGREEFYQIYSNENIQTLQKILSQSKKFIESKSFITRANEGMLTPEEEINFRRELRRQEMIQIVLIEKELNQLEGMKL